MSSELEIEFDQSAENIKKSNLNLDNDTLLSLYSYFKQAKFGDCSEEAPSMFDFKNKAKYDAWKKNMGMKQEKAMKHYIKLVNRLLK
jgi:diazepam-binding inhibitor (GABA receptor modulator, acyl-CoA-binding protein)